MILLNLYKNKNKKMPEAYGKYYARPAITQTVDADGLGPDKYVCLATTIKLP